MKNNHRMGGKLDEKWDGPYEIVEKLTRGRSRLKSLKGGILKKLYNSALLKDYFETDCPTATKENEEDCPTPINVSPTSKSLQSSTLVKKDGPMSSTPCHDCTPQLRISIKEKSVSVCTAIAEMAFYLKIMRRWPFT